MTQEEKQLLLQDLCTRLPYRVLCVDMEGKTRPLFGITPTQHFIVTLDNATDGTNGLKFCTIDCIKPYLRPMSSMTEEEKEGLLMSIVGNDGIKYFQVLVDGSIDNTDATIQDLNKFNMHWVNFDKDTVTLYIDWLLEHHFDFRNLIEKGLAIEVTKENNPYEYGNS